MIFIFIIHQGLDYIYRPYIYSNSIFDFYFADSFTNLTAVVGLSALALYQKSEKIYANKNSEYELIIMPVICIIIYEFLQIIVPWSTFSIIDIIYSIIGGVFILILKKFLYDKWVKQ